MEDFKERLHTEVKELLAGETVIETRLTEDMNLWFIVCADGFSESHNSLYQDKKVVESLYLEVQPDSQSSVDSLIELMEEIVGCITNDELVNIVMASDCHGDEEKYIFLDGYTYYNDYLDDDEGFFDDNYYDYFEADYSNFEDDYIDGIQDEQYE